MGRFHPDGGVADPELEAAWALPNGVLFVNGALPEAALDDDLGHPACQPLRLGGNSMVAADLCADI